MGKEQKKHGVSIFSCGDWDVFSDVRVDIGGGYSTQMVQDVNNEFHQIKRKVSGTWVNWAMFYQVWLQIRFLGKWETKSWTVKVDADAVFLPNRLQRWLRLEVWRMGRGCLRAAVLGQALRGQSGGIRHDLGRCLCGRSPRGPKEEQEMACRGLQRGDNSSCASFQDPQRVFRLQSACCQVSGHTCYRKNYQVAMCNE